MQRRFYSCALAQTKYTEYTLLHMRLSSLSAKNQVVSVYRKPRTRASARCVNHRAFLGHKELQ